MASVEDLSFIDYLAPLILVIIFSLLIFIISFTCINFFCIAKDDELTVFDNFGKRNHFRLGPHSFKKIEEIKRRKKI
ncbi:Hypothetical protein SRAE_X000173250 [Strongyloides ratti]|uniref:Uncharacterized protein n=1 Tax=Strongyloides ratti TaxID=34506 RepID=A0A090MPF7_STRRB|nr:Hypothetical protein SRAE_X000173250 [Strongyloides ratti]CEF59992.1 Hypothetical protein SRAE_X000173250 [Strongyloides ratti]